MIFGINGQDGYYLNQLLQKEGIEVIGISRRNPDWVIGDVSNTEQVSQLIKYYKPDFIFHLAANSTTRHDALFENHQTISTGTLNILEAVHRYSSTSKVFISGSALQFKNVGKPISEEDPFEGGSPYSIARIHSVYAARYYRSLGLQTYVGYFFHHDSPLRGQHHLNKKITDAVKRIKKGSDEVLQIGSIDVIKEYNYAADIVNAIWLFVNQDAISEAVIGSGKGYSVKDWLQICFDKVGKDWKEFVVLQENFKPEFASLVSDPRSIKSLGWMPSMDISDLAEIMLAE